VKPYAVLGRRRGAGLAHVCAFGAGLVNGDVCKGMYYTIHLYLVSRTRSVEVLLGNLSGGLKSQETPLLGGLVAGH